MSRIFNHHVWLSRQRFDWLRRHASAKLIRFYNGGTSAEIGGTRYHLEQGQ